MKRELDSNGVFHPEANAHRVHCLYRLKLYKNLNCYSIEYPILKEMHEVDSFPQYPSLLE
jgi:hypothetical protein